MLENVNPTIPNNDDCGLFIGVNDYRAYEESTGLMVGRACLPGSVNDAKAFFRLARKMGMRLDNVRVLTTPALDPADLGPGVTSANVGRATRESIEQGVRWLADRLGANKAIAGLLTYSGHGSYTEAGGLVVCPSDTRATAGGGLENVLPYSKLGELMGASGDQLTTVLDCCHSGTAPDQDDRIPSLGKVPVPEKVTGKDMAFAGRVLAACGPGGVTQQAMFMGAFHGAFSWAITSVLGQWQTVPDGDGRRVTLTYGDLTDRATKLVRSLSLRCSPQVDGPENVKRLAVMQRGHEPADTSVTPDGLRLSAQMDPGDKDYRVYSLFDSNGGVATVLVPRISVSIGGTSYASGLEHWFSVKTSTPSSRVIFYWTDYYSTDAPPTLGTLDFTMPQTPGWTTNTSVGTINSASNRFVNNTLGLTLEWLLTYSSTASPKWSGTLKWWNGSSFLAFSGLSSGLTFSAGTAGIKYWHLADVPPTIPA